MPGTQYMLLGDKEISERDIAYIKMFTCKIVALLLLLGVCLIVITHM